MKPGRRIFFITIIMLSSTPNYGLDDQVKSTPFYSVAFNEINLKQVQIRTDEELKYPRFEKKNPKQFVIYLNKINQPYVLTNGYPESILNQVTPITDVVSTNIITSGTGANAGGRSGTISLDGMLSVSVGANTIDRQSLWLDMAGGAVINIGRDRFLRSLSAQFDGDVLIQIGGATVDNDSRFPGSNFNNDIRDGALDIRIMNSGSMHIIRCDKQGLKIHTPQAIDVVAESDIRLKSVRGNIYLDAENIYVYSGKSGGGRLINRNDSTLG